MAQRRDAQPGDAAGGGEHQAFGQHLAHQPAALGAQRGAQADLALARGAARQQQVGDVDAGDEQHQRDRADQREQRRPELADQSVPAAGRASPCGGHCAAALLSRARRRCRASRCRPARTTTPSRSRAIAYELPRPLRRAQLLQRLPVGNQEIGLLADDREAGRHHADHRPRAVIGRQRHAEHIARPAKSPLPEFVTQHDDRVVAAEVFLGGVGAAERRLDAQRAKDVGRDGEARQPRYGWPLTIMVMPAGPTIPGARAFGSARARPRSWPGQSRSGGAAAVGFPHRHDAIGLAGRAAAPASPCGRR